MTIAIHQINFLPWLPFFEKMHQADIFVMLTEVQFEKNGFVNRTKVNGKWWTNPVHHGLKSLIDKRYTDGQSLIDINLSLIVSIAKMLGIDISKIRFDFPTQETGTARIVEICQRYKADRYLTNPAATDKYLDGNLLRNAGIEIVPFISKNRKHVFELFNEIGVQKTKELLRSEPKEHEKDAQGNKDSNAEQRSPVHEASVKA